MSEVARSCEHVRQGDHVLLALCHACADAAAASRDKDERWLDYLQREQAYQRKIAALEAQLAISDDERVAWRADVKRLEADLARVREESAGLRLALEDRKEFIRINAGSLLAQRDEKIENQRATLARLQQSNDSYRNAIDKANDEIERLHSEAREAARRLDVLTVAIQRLLITTQRGYGHGNVTDEWVAAADQARAALAAPDPREPIKESHVCSSKHGCPACSGAPMQDEPRSQG